MNFAIWDQNLRPKSAKWGGWKLYTPSCEGTTNFLGYIHRYLYLFGSDWRSRLWNFVSLLCTFQSARNIRSDPQEKIYFWIISLVANVDIKFIFWGIDKLFKLYFRYYFSHLKPFISFQRINHHRGKSFEALPETQFLCSVKSETVWWKWNKLLLLVKPLQIFSVKFQVVWSVKGDEYTLDNASNSELSIVERLGKFTIEVWDENFKSDI